MVDDEPMTRTRRERFTLLPGADPGTITGGSVVLDALMWVDRCVMSANRACDCGIGTGGVG